MKEVLKKMIQRIRKSAQPFTNKDFEKLDGYFLNESMIPSLQITNFEYAGKNMQKITDSQTAFISLTQKRLRSNVSKATPWFSSYRFERKALLGTALYITEVPIEAFADRVPQFIVPNTLRFLYQVARSLREQLAIPVIATTGFAGMSIPRRMIDHLFREEYQVLSNQCSQTPRLSLLLFLTKLIQSPELLNVELAPCVLDSEGTDTLADLLHPTVAVIAGTCWTEKQASQDLDAVADHSANLFKGLDEQGSAIISADLFAEQREILYAAAKKRTSRIFTYSRTCSSADMHLLSLKELKDITEVTASYHGERYTYYLRSSSVEVIEGSLATLLILKTMGMEPENYLAYFSSFYDFPRLMERSCGYMDGKKVEIINDTHRSDVPSMIDALTSFTNKNDYFSGKKIVILGYRKNVGEAEESLRHSINASQADLLLGYGQGLREIIRSSTIPALWFPTIEECFGEMLEQLTENSLILVKGETTQRDQGRIHSLLTQFLTKQRK